jgi:signal transduction histidine kinase
MYQGGWSGEVTQQRRDGQPIVTDMSIFPIHAPDGAFMTYGMVVQDATERRQLLDVIQRANARFEAILDATDDGIIVWDEFWRVLLVNPAACRLLAEQPDELIASTHDDWEAQPLLAAVANAQEDQQIEFPGDRPRVGRCRNLRWQSDRASGHLTLISDVTSQVELEKWREEMTSMLIHDLVSPLNSLVGGLEMAQEMLTEGEDQARVLEFMDMANRNGWVLLSMINSMLDINRLESGRTRLDYTPLQVNTLFEEVIGILANSAQAAKISVTTSCEDDLPALLADHGMIRRTLTNLLDNALKFTPDGGKVVLMARREGDSIIRFSVADTGPGIPEAYRRKLFQRYSRVPGQEGRRRGTGLGLVFCRLVAEAHHGRIWVEPGPEGGSVFHFTIMGGEQTDQSTDAS